MPDTQREDEIWSKGWKSGYKSGRDASREEVAAMMLRLDIAPGHGDTIDDLLGECGPVARGLDPRQQA